MKEFFHVFNILILIFFISYTKEDVCSEGQISISALGKCKNITELLENEDITLKTENLLYLASNNEGKIEKNGYKLEIFKLSDPKLQSHNIGKSKLYIPNSCLEEMENNSNIKLDKSKGIVILVYNYNNVNKNNISDIYFIIRHKSEGSTKQYINSKVFDLSFCHKDPIIFEDEIKLEYLRYNYTDNTAIDLDTILYGKKLGIDFFDPYSAFLNDICFKFTSEKGTDVTLESRVEDYYQNITFCDDKESSHYLSYNYSPEKNTFTFRCAFGFYASEADKSSYLDIIDSELKSLVSVSNFKVITCYKQFLNLRDIVKNYGGMICIIVLIIQLICFLIFCFSGTKPIQNKLKDLFKLGAAIINRLIGRNIGVGRAKNNKNKKNKKGKQKKKFNLWGTVRLILKKKKIEREKQEQQNQQKKDSNPPKKDKKRKSVNLEIKDDGIEEIKENKEGIGIKANNNENKDVIQKKAGKKGKKRKSKVSHKKEKEKENENDVIKIEDINLEENINIEKKPTDKIRKIKNKTLISKSSMPSESKEDTLNTADKSVEEKGNMLEKTGKKGGTKKGKLLSKSSRPKDNQVELLISDYTEEDKKDNHLEQTNIISNNSRENSKNQSISKFKDTPKKETESKYTQDGKRSDKSQIYDYGPDELNELPLQKAIKHDNRTFCKYYWDILKFCHIILNVFLRYKDYNLFVVKLGLLLMTFPINLTFNIFFYTNKSIEINYIKSMDDISTVWDNISKTIYSSVLSSTLLIILKLLALTHKSVKALKKIKDVGFAKKKSVGVLRCIKIRITIYFILSFGFLIIFGFYNLCFCAIFENTQKEVVKSTLSSWLISLSYPFVICFFTSTFRSLAFKWNNQCLYVIKLLMQFL